MISNEELIARQRARIAAQAAAGISGRPRNIVDTVIRASMTNDELVARQRARMGAQKDAMTKAAATKSEILAQSEETYQRFMKAVRAQAELKAAEAAKAAAVAAPAVVEPSAPAPVETVHEQSVPASVVPAVETPKSVEETVSGLLLGGMAMEPTASETAALENIGMKPARVSRRKRNKVI